MCRAFVNLHVRNGIRGKERITLLSNLFHFLRVPAAQEEVQLEADLCKSPYVQARVDGAVEQREAEGQGVDDAGVGGSVDGVLEELRHDIRAVAHQEKARDDGQLPDDSVGVFG